MRLLAASLALITGCSAVVDDDSMEESVGAADTSLRARVSVQRTESTQGHRTHVAARFLRTSGDLAEAEQLVDGGSIEERAPLGCVELTEATRPLASSQPFNPQLSNRAPIELLDVGDIVLVAQVEDAARQVPLAPHAFPDVGGLVSGVVYTSRDGRRTLPHSTPYAFEVSGVNGQNGLDAVRFEGVSLVAEAPAAPEGVRLGDVFLVSDQSDVVVQSGESLELAWATGAGDSDDRIVVSVSLAGASLVPGADDDAQAFQCSFEDDGSAEIPGALMNFDDGAALDVSVHRQRHTTMVVPGTEYDAMIDFDFAVAGQVVVD